MRTGIEIKQDLTCVDLRRLAKRETSGRVVARMLAIASVIDGMKREFAARQAGMARSRLHVWIARYNQCGIDGLRDKPKGHARRRLTEKQEQQLIDLINEGTNGILTRWRCVDLKEEIKTRFNVDYTENSVCKILRRLGFSHMSVRPLHPKADLETQEAFKKTFHQH